MALWPYDTLVACVYTVAYHRLRMPRRPTLLPPRTSLKYRQPPDLLPQLLPPALSLLAGRVDDGLLQRRSHFLLDVSVLPPSRRLLMAAPSEVAYWLGQHVQAFWPDLGEWYTGTVTDYDPVKGFLIHYEDGTLAALVKTRSCTLPHAAIVTRR
jgi:hypothetical protein